jgi:hypothetical protein
MSEEYHDSQKQKPAFYKGLLTTLIEEPPYAPVPGTHAEPPPFQDVAPPSSDLLTRVKWFWHKDLASKIFLVTLTALLVISLLFAFSANTLLARVLPPPPPRFDMQPNDEPKVNGTVDLHPTFSVTYDKKNRTTTSSLPPKTGTIATLSGTPTTSLQITNIPGQVDDNDSVDVTVNGPPNTSVMLAIQYNVDPYSAQSSSETTDSSGNATLTWKVDVNNKKDIDVYAQVSVVGGGSQSGAATVEVNT